MSFSTILLSWPDCLSLDSYESQSLERSACLVRLGHFQHAESSLLALITRKASSLRDALALLGYLRLKQGSISALRAVIGKLEEDDSDSWQSRWLTAHLLFQTGRTAELIQKDSFFWRDISKNPLLGYLLISSYLVQRDLLSAETLLNKLEKPYSLDALRLQAGLLNAKGKPLQALELLKPALLRAPNDRYLIAQIFDLVIGARVAPEIVPIARTVLNRHGEHPDVLNNVTAVKLFQRQPGFARRAALLLQTWTSVGLGNAGMPNQICSYEQCGHADWIEFLHPAIWEQPLVNIELSGNLALHLASVQSPRYVRHLTNFLGSVASTPAQKKLAIASTKLKPLDQKKTNHLKIAWVTGDLSPHPVSRFLEHFFVASHEQRRHQHIVVSVNDHGTDSVVPKFQGMPNLDLLDVSRVDNLERVSRIRSLQADIAIDLSGWTGGHFAFGFLARLAPIQINYLGYFASSGIPSIDYWLGDSELFPERMSEWHSEKIWRLKRPFIAWQPPASLPEGCVEITDPPSGSIRFGSFNHNRKLSDKTLSLWGKLLNNVPGSKLVLKASSSEDQPTQTLLRRRMLRNGLDPERVEWLALTATCEEHLMQYRNIDVSLDPFPNGGCTTTCEALWMGTPVVTMEGNHYVSRMSTAVLRGSNCPEWVCSSENEYLNCCIKIANDLQSFRQTRDLWRKKLINSPLGNAADLMQNLEFAFEEMIQAQISN